MNEQKKYQNFSVKKSVNMYKSIITSQVRKQITRYGEFYLEWFISRFSDTGLGHAESIIQKQYIESSDILVESIYHSIETATIQEIISYAPLENWIRETSIRLGNRRIFIQYEEDLSSMTRFIIDIEILRR